MTPAKIISFLGTMASGFEKTALVGEAREGLAKRLRKLLTVVEGKKTDNRANWGHSASPMPPDYQSSSDTPPM